MEDRKWRRRYESSKPAYEALMKYYPLTLENLDGEQWRKVYDGYHVSNFGRVKSFLRGKARILQPLLNSAGYLQVNLYIKSKCKIFRVHRLVATAFIPNTDNKPQVNHIDGCRLNNFVGNLEWATHAENIQHSQDMGLAKSGVESVLAKLTKEQVVYIRDNPLNLTLKELGEIFGVDMSTISLVQLGKHYKNTNGFVREAQKHSEPLPQEIRNEIRCVYVKRSVEFGSVALGKRYGVDHKTILNIVNEK